MAVTARRIYLRFVPKKDRETVRGLGARYDRDMRRWFAPRYVDPAVFTAWLPAPAPVADKADGHGCHNAASANLVVPRVLPYQEPYAAKTWATGGTVRRIRR
jgi:hypothetical protein